MIGTSHELLLYLSYHEDIKEELKLTRPRLVLLRHLLSQHKVQEEYLVDALTRLGCRCIRPRVVLPCIIKDKNGRMYDEYTFLKIFFTPELAKKYNVDYRKILGIVKSNHSIDRHLFKHILKSRRAWIVVDNMLLDSVWSYEPIDLTMTGEKVKQVRNMIQSSVPVCDDYYSIQTYQRNEPVLEHPDDNNQMQPASASSL